MKNGLRGAGGSAGLTIAELLIALALIGVGILGSIGAFNYIQRAIGSSKGGTLATNLAQEKMQILMQKTYFEILVTTNPVPDNDFSPSFNYDTGYFPPESVLQGSIWFTRLTNVQVVQEYQVGNGSGTLQVLSPSAPDTGMRLITVYVVWSSPTGKHYVTLQSVINNPSTVMSDATITGQVTDAVSSAPIPSANVVVAENVGWRDITTNSPNPVGYYTLHMSPGSFHIGASANGYYPSNAYYSVFPPPTANIPQNFKLTPISTGTINGSAWLNNHLVISQIVGSTVTAGGLRQEFVELYNPTTFYINMAVAGVPSVLLKWQKQGDPSPTTWTLDYTVANSTVAPSSYYLIANTTTIQMNGISRTADAQFDASVPNYPNPILILSDPGSAAASLGLSTTAGTWIDLVGWTQGGMVPADYPPLYETTPILNVTGLVDGEQFVRRSTTNTVINGVGRAYNDNYNAMDFVGFGPPALFFPQNSGDVETPVVGMPAVGANVSVTDGLSTSAKATLTGSPPYAQFIVQGVATGTWTTFIDSGTSSAEIDNISIVANSTASLGGVILSTAGVDGIISGYVTDVLGNAPGSWIPPGVNVGISGQTYPVNAITGHYSVRLPTGTYNVTANPNLGNGAYEMQTITGSSVTLGDETANINFQLSNGGRLSGWITRDGLNPLPGVSVSGIDADGITHDTEVSGNNGSFTLINLTTGVYTVEPILDPKETSTPTSSTMTVVAGSNIVIGTFTVAGAMGVVVGSVTVSGSPIQTGVLVVISTAAITLPPPAISSNTLTSAAYYDGSSQEDGTYSVQVRGSTSTVYNIVGFYMHINGQTPVISTKTITGVTVTAGQTTSGENFAW